MATGMPATIYAGRAGGSAVGVRGPSARGPRGFNMRMIRPGRGTVRRAVVAMLCAGPLAAGALALTARAQPSRTVADGVYTAGQAARGAQIYQAQCVTCHGEALEGSVGPPLAGDGFLSVWSALPLAELVDKIHNTMPLQATAPLSRQESIDLTAYILEAGAFPTGEAELADAALADIALPTVATASAAAAGGDLSVAPIANLAQLMRAIAFPALEHRLQRADQGTPRTTCRRRRQPGPSTSSNGDRRSIRDGRPSTSRRSPSPSPRPLPGARSPVRERPAGPRRPGRLAGVHRGGRRGGRVAYRASQSRSVDAVIEATDQLNEACASCHEVYRDVGAEGRGVGADRCRQEP